MAHHQLQRDHRREFGRRIDLGCRRLQGTIISILMSVNESEKFTTTEIEDLLGTDRAYLPMRKS